MAIPAAVAAAVMVPAVVGPSKPSLRIKHISGLNSFGGLKPLNNPVASLGLPLCSHQCFAKLVSSFKGTQRGGATCSAIDEIFRIASIMPALVLVGVAVGFVLLRIEAAFEEE